MSSTAPRHTIFGAVAACALAAATGNDAAAQDSSLVELQLELPDEDENHEDASAYNEVTNAVEIRRYFNLARCECGQNFGLEMQILDSAQAPQRPVELFVGSSCDDVELRDMLCEDLGAPFGDASNDLRNPQTVLIPIDAVADPGTRMCPDSELTGRVYVMVDDDGDPAQFAYVDIFELFLDLNPPPEPASIEARGSEESAVVEWELSETRIDDFEFFQILCAEVTGPDTVAPVFDDPADPEYETAAQVCGAAASPRVVLPHGGGGLDAGPDAGSDAGTGPTLPPGLAELDPAFVCGTGTFGATDIRVTGLTDGVEYHMVWVGIDPSRNPTAVDLGVVTPGPLIDFWEDYKNQGGGAQGGYCFVATAAYGDYNHPMVVVLQDFRDNTLARFALGRWLIRTYYDLSPPLAAFIREHTGARVIAAALLLPLVVAAGIWEYTGFLGKLALILAFVLYRRLRARRRGEQPARVAKEARRPPRHRAAIATAAAAVVLLAANAASAQTWPSGFEELEEEAPGVPSPSDVKWNFELKFGPYVPDVDSEFDATGPFERVFGDGPFLMSHIGLDRFFLWPAGGQLGASVGLGFLTKSASVFADDNADGVADMDADGNPIRVSGETTTFRLVPLSASAVYRLTLLDDRANVPLVPYGKLGLSYYLWWVTRPDGSTSSACENPGDDPATCDQTDARGGSLGFQATVGLALRAERIDPDAGVHLRNELGIEHAGIFAELTYANVDGFGSDTKLAVGDLTWFAGVNFEF
jgi:hypothetical protein